MPDAYDYSLSFYRRYYRPENTVLLVVGDFDPAATSALIEKYYGAWATGYRPPRIAPEPPQTAPRSADVAFPGRTLPILAVAYKGAAFDPFDRDYAAARLVGELAFGPRSELHKKLVLRQRRVESLHCDIPMNRDPSLFTIEARVKNIADIAAVRDEIDRTLAEFQTKPVDLQTLADLKCRQRYGFLMEMDSPAHVAGNLTRFIAATGGIEAVDQWFDTTEKITPEDVQREARKFFTPERRTVVVLRGTEDAGPRTEGRKPQAGEKKPLASRAARRVPNGRSGI